MKHLKKIFISMLLIALLAFSGFLIYTLDYYRADDVALRNKDWKQSRQFLNLSDD